jgi:hypothetical protein
MMEEPLELELDPQVQVELAAHPGKWVALTRSEVLAVGDSVAAVLKQAAARGYDSPILMRVPDADPAAFYF